MAFTRPALYPHMATHSDFTEKHDLFDRQEFCHSSAPYPGFPAPLRYTADLSSRFLVLWDEDLSAYTLLHLAFPL